MNDKPLWPMLYWGAKIDNRNAKGFVDPMGVLVSLFVTAFTKVMPEVQPADFIRHDVARADRVELAKALAIGEEHEAYMGWANCRICDAQLGTKDLKGWGFMWPEKAEHYILEHDVWTPDCTRLLAATRLT